MVLDQTTEHHSLAKLIHTINHFGHLLAWWLSFSDDIHNISLLGRSGKVYTWILCTMWVGSGLSGTPGSRVWRGFRPLDLHMSVCGSLAIFPTRLWEQHGGRDVASWPIPSENRAATRLSSLCLDGLTMGCSKLHPEGSDANALGEERWDPFPRGVNPVAWLCPSASFRKDQAIRYIHLRKDHQEALSREFILHDKVKSKNTQLIAKALIKWKYFPKNSSPKSRWVPRSPLFSGFQPWHCPEMPKIKYKIKKEWLCWNHTDL